MSLLPKLERKRGVIDDGVAPLCELESVIGTTSPAMKISRIVEVEEDEQLEVSGLFARRGYRVEVAR